MRDMQVEPNLHGGDLGHGDHGGEKSHKRSNIYIDHTGSSAIGQAVGTRAAHSPLFPVFSRSIARPNSQQNRLPCGHQCRRET